MNVNVNVNVNVTVTGPVKVRAGGSFSIIAFVARQARHEWLIFHSFTHSDGPMDKNDGIMIVMRL